MAGEGLRAERDAGDPHRAGGLERGNLVLLARVQPPVVTEHHDEPGGPVQRIAPRAVRPVNQRRRLFEEQHERHTAVRGHGGPQAVGEALLRRERDPFEAGVLRVGARRD